MRNAFASLKCSKKCQHNVQRPSARRQPYEAVHERIWNLCNNLLRRTTEQRMGCFWAYTWYRTENPVLIPFSTFNQSLGSKFGWPSSFASYAKICHSCPLEFVIVFRLKNLRPRGRLASAVVIWSHPSSWWIHPRGYWREFNKRWSLAYSFYIKYVCALKSSDFWEPACSKSS